MLLTNNQFISELGKLFMTSRMEGQSQSIRITIKPYDGRKKPVPKNGDFGDMNQVIFRARVGSKKISTAINQKEVNNFHAQYAACLARNMDGLQKAKKQETNKPLR
ncbi:unnamed protein product, partial [Mesorhabditis belari]|uniref:Signal recognition particle 14 kDa protein n=1 Tax=Mesorhabditis belari TaxID=2138241 RepID=A0AAF3FJG1_9BILA